MKNHVLKYALLLFAMSSAVVGCGKEAPKDPPQEGNKEQCGNGTVDTNEKCDKGISTGDGSCPTQETCQNMPQNVEACIKTYKLSGSGDTCSAECVADELIENCTPGGGTKETCGNGVLDEGEKCDPKIQPGSEGACPNDIVCGGMNSACVNYKLEGDRAQCSATCEKTEITQCKGGDGCCPSGCTGENDSDCLSVHGGECTDKSDCRDGVECATNLAGGLCRKDCNDSADCGEGSTCFQQAGVCLQECNANDPASVAACGKYRICHNGACFPEPEIACKSNDDCLAGFTCDTTYTTEGVCRYENKGVKKELEKCQSASECSASATNTNMDCTAILANRDTAESRCLPRCNSRVSCPTGFQCYNDSSEALSYCLPECTTSNDCKTKLNTNGYRCVNVGDEKAPKNTCVYIPTYDVENVGNKCDSDDDCSGKDAICVKDEVGYTGGYCTTKCDLSPKEGDNRCPEDSYCLPIRKGSAKGLCTKACKDVNECSDQENMRCSKIIEQVDIKFCNIEPKTTPLDATNIGNACDAQNSCAGSDAICADRMYMNGGYCTAVCNIGTGVCPTGSKCIASVDGVSHFCFKECTADADCSSVNAAAVCDKKSKSCIVPPSQNPLDISNVGAACSNSNPCGGSDAICQDGPLMSGGYCTGQCLLGKGVCPDGSTCVLVGERDSDALCIDVCTKNTDCAQPNAQCLKILQDGNEKHCVVTPKQP